MNILKKIREDGSNMEVLKGIAGSEGYGTGKAVIISNEIPEYEDRKITDIEAEKSRLQSVFDEFLKKTEDMVERMKDSVGESNTAILEGHIMMLQDPYMQEEIMNRIDEGKCAETAVREACDTFIQMFSQTDDELIKQRATDVGDIQIRLLKLLTGTPDINISDVPKGTILVAKDLTPSMTAGIVKENVAGIVTQLGGITSHSAILSRALEIPAVLSVKDVMNRIKSGMTIAVDGGNGVAVIEADAKTVAEYEEKRKRHLEDKEALKAYIGKGTRTADGIQVELYGNIGKPEDAKKVLECDGEGIGLFRTEFLFMDSDSLPDEDKQFEAYKAAAEAMNGREVIIRTLDIGGDKEIPYMGLSREDNPFLGYRAVRYCLDHKDIYSAQLRAILRASAYGNIKIMVPLVTCVDEIRGVKKLVEDIKEQLDREGINYDKTIETGVMIETPAASEIADLLAREADFFSIGTNDLTQYTMAVDRGNAKVAYLYSVYQPSVIRSLKRIIAEANKAGIKVGMCGEAAADVLLAPLLISFGLNEYSVSPVSILKTRKNIGSWTKAEADKVAEKVLLMDSAEEIEDFLKKQVK